MIEQEKRLSYKYSLWHLLGNILIAIVFCSVSWIHLTVTSSENSVVNLLQIAVALFFTILVTCQLLYQSTAYVRGDRIKLKKLFRAELNYTTKQIIKVKKYNLSRVHYTFVTMRNVDGTTERFMIMNIYAWYAQSIYDAQEVLEELRKKG